ncbi:VOC family protein [Candidatus Micrarchaeota archaeon]|nr:VOC family protein [Candidatus Micrarchaeota archaeon]
MDRVTHFDVPVNDVKRAKQFYAEAFQWQCSDVPGMGYTMITTTAVDDQQMPKQPGAINGGMFKRNKEHPVQNVTAVVAVDNLEEKMKAVEAAGGKILAPVQKVGEMGLHALVEDTEGNTFGIWQSIKKG